MNYQEHVAPDPRMSGEAATVGCDLASFISEAEIPETPFKVEAPKHPLWQFPEEGLPSHAVGNGPVESGKLPMYPALGAAIFVVATAGAWWGGLMVPSRTAAANAPSGAMVRGSIVNPPADVSGDQPTKVIESGAVPPLTRAPVASIGPSPVRKDTQRSLDSPSKIVPLFGAASETIQSQERVNSAPRGTIGAAPAPSPLRFVSRASIEPLPNAPMALASSVARTPAPEPAPALEASPAVSLPALRLPAPMRPEPEALPSIVARTEQSEIQRTLGQYRSAYQLLDAESARAVWPSVDVRALARAFDSLTSQQLAFETCQFDIIGEAATAQCRGSATYTPKVGNREPKLEPRQWTFHLRKVGEDWKIQRAQTRR